MCRSIGGQAVRGNGEWAVRAPVAAAGSSQVNACIIALSLAHWSGVDGILD